VTRIGSPLTAIRKPRGDTGFRGIGTRTVESTMDARRRGGLRAPCATRRDTPLRLLRCTRGRAASTRTFDAYCKERWGWTIRHAERLMSAGEVVQRIKATDRSRLPTHETHVRPLARCVVRLGAVGEKRRRPRRIGAFAAVILGSASCGRFARWSLDAPRPGVAGLCCYRPWCGLCLLTACRAMPAVPRRAAKGGCLWQAKPL